MVDVKRLVIEIDARPAQQGGKQAEQALQAVGSKATTAAKDVAQLEGHLGRLEKTAGAAAKTGPKLADGLATGFQQVSRLSQATSNLSRLQATFGSGSGQVATALSAVAGAAGAAEVAVTALNSAVLVNPFVLAAAAVTGLSVAYLKLRDNAKDASEAQRIANEVNQRTASLRDEYRQRTEDDAKRFADDQAQLEAEIAAREEATRRYGAPFIAGFKQVDAIKDATFDLTLSDDEATRQRVVQSVVDSLREVGNAAGEAQLVPELNAAFAEFFATRDRIANDKLRESFAAEAKDIDQEIGLLRQAIAGTIDLAEERRVLAAEEQARSEIASNGKIGEEEANALIEERVSKVREQIQLEKELKAHEEAKRAAEDEAAAAVEKSARQQEQLVEDRKKAELQAIEDRKQAEEQAIEDARKAQEQAHQARLGQLNEQLEAVEKQRAEIDAAARPYGSAIGGAVGDLARGERPGSVLANLGTRVRDIAIEQTIEKPIENAFTGLFTQEQDAQIAAIQAEIDAMENLRQSVISLDSSIRGAPVATSSGPIPIDATGNALPASTTPSGTASGGLLARGGIALPAGLGATEQAPSSSGGLGGIVSGILGGSGGGIGGAAGGAGLGSLLGSGASSLFGGIGSGLGSIGTFLGGAGGASTGLAGIFSALGTGAGALGGALGYAIPVIGPLIGPLLGALLSGGFDQGGLVPGPYLGRDDRLAPVAGEEFIVNAENSRRFREDLEGINAGRGPRRAVGSGEGVAIYQTFNVRDYDSFRRNRFQVSQDARREAERLR